MAVDTGNEIGAAWCPKCEQTCLPVHGKCGFCDTDAVPYDSQDTAAAATADELVEAVERDVDEYLAEAPPLFNVGERMECSVCGDLGEYKVAGVRYCEEHLP